MKKRYVFIICAAAFLIGALSGSLLTLGGSAQIKPRGADAPEIRQLKLYPSEKTGEESLLVNINTATERELSALPGFGEKTARSVIEYREKYGAFKSADEITSVKGVGDALYEKVKDLITAE